MSPTTVRQRQVQFRTPERPAAALASTHQLARRRMLESSSPVRAVDPDEALSSPTAHPHEQQARNRAGTEDPFTAAIPIRSSPPVLQLNCDRLGAAKDKIVGATQRRYDDEMSVLQLVIDAFKYISNNKIANAEQLRLMETATENLPDLWTGLIGLGKAQPDKKDRGRHAGTTYAGVAASAATHEPSPPSTGKQFPRKPHGRPIKTDKRVLIRMPLERATEQSTYSIKKHIVDTLQLKSTQILDARKIQTGWSVYPDTTETQQFILSEQQKWLPALNATQADKQETWYTFIVEDCPRHLRNITGDHTPLMDAAYDEIVTAAGQAPVNFHIRNKDDNATPNAVLIVSFKQRQAGGWKLFGTSGKARLVTRRATLAQCQQCWGYHQTISCTRTACCKNCGSREHIENCSETPRCANCLGPHSADDTHCYARPKIVNGNVEKLSKLQRQRARRQGAQDYAAAKRNRTDEPTTTVTTTNQAMDTHPTQPDTEIDTREGQPNAPPTTAANAAPLQMLPLPQRGSSPTMATSHGNSSQAISNYTDALTSPASPAGSPAKRKRITGTTEPDDESAEQTMRPTRLTKEQLNLIKPQYRPGYVRPTARSTARR